MPDDRRGHAPLAAPCRHGRRLNRGRGRGMSDALAKATAPTPRRTNAACTSTKSAAASAGCGTSPWPCLPVTASVACRLRSTCAWLTRNRTMTLNSRSCDCRRGTHPDLRGCDEHRPMSGSRLPGRAGALKRSGGAHCEGPYMPDAALGRHQLLPIGPTASGVQRQHPRAATCSSTTGATSSASPGPPDGPGDPQRTPRPPGHVGHRGPGCDDHCRDPGAARPTSPCSSASAATCWARAANCGSRRAVARARRLMSSVHAPVAESASPVRANPRSTSWRASPVRCRAAALMAPTALARALAGRDHSPSRACAAGSSCRNPRRWRRTARARTSPVARTVAPARNGRTAGGGGRNEGSPGRCVHLQRGASGAGRL
jgi:hypothetical protein